MTWGHRTSAPGSKETVLLETQDTFPLLTAGPASLSQSAHQPGPFLPPRLGKASRTVALALVLSVTQHTGSRLVPGLQALVCSPCCPHTSTVTLISLFPPAPRPPRFCPQLAPWTASLKSDILYNALDTPEGPCDLNPPRYHLEIVIEPETSI